MAGLESLRTPDEVAELRGISINQVLGLTAEPEAPEPGSNGNGAAEAAPEPDAQAVEVAET